jgi:hypothetical protein
VTVPTQGESFAIFIEHLRKAQEQAAMLAHLYRAEGSAKDQLLAQGWLGISELIKRMIHQTTELAKGKLQ